MRLHLCCHQVTPSLWNSPSPECFCPCVHSHAGTQSERRRRRRPTVAQEATHTSPSQTDSRVKTVNRGCVWRSTYHFAVVYHRLVWRPFSRVPPQNIIIEIDWQRSRSAGNREEIKMERMRPIICSPQKVYFCVQRVTTLPESGGNTLLDGVGGVRRDPIRIRRRVFHLTKT
jgi:hypothetical protein